MSAVTYVKVLPDCDICAAGGVQSTAHYDGKTTEGPWANMCSPHFTVHGTGLGTGKGQRLVVGEEPVPTDAERRAKVQAAVEAGDLDALEEAIGDGDPAEYL